MKALNYLFLFVLIAFSGYTHGQVICIDPGHGYGSNGENSDGRTQEEIVTNCEVGLLLRDTLEKQAYTVIMTRTHSDTGSWMSLTQRAALADNYDSDRLLSIHCNGGGGTGTETFWCYRNSPNRAIDSTFSLLTQAKMVYYGQWTDRRSIEDEIYLGFHLGVLKGATPGCLSEIGFVDKPSDLVKLLDPSWQKQFAWAYSEAINVSFTIDYPSYTAPANLNVSFYPNPFIDQICIEGISGSYNRVQIYDLLGRLITESNLNDDAGGQTFINVSNLSAGSYLLVVKSDRATLSRIIVKAKP